MGIIMDSRSSTGKMWYCVSIICEPPLTVSVKRHRHDFVQPFRDYFEGPAGQEVRISC